ncbi:MAG TPA: inositol monophosphatase family protein [Anaerolineales bacterium]|nr:inositol monophosphatase family protein [Anaerolineales bacterium]
MPPVLADLERLARQAGEILRLGYEGKHQVSYKGVIDLVTEVDKQSEDLLLGEIQRAFPGHQIISEEIGVVPGREGDQWFVDPLDGTVNYAHGIPVFCVSIGYAHNGEIVLAAVYDPLRDELFTAERGRGSHLNGRPLSVSQASELQRSLLVTGFAYDLWTTPNDNLDNFGRLAKLSQGVRRLGSAALDLCYVAAGRFDGYWELSLRQWDMAAGSLIATEAGATVTTLEGRPDILTPPCSLIAASPAIHARLLETLNRKD